MIGDVKIRFNIMWGKWCTNTHKILSIENHLYTFNFFFLPTFNTERKCSEAYDMYFESSGGVGKNYMSLTRK